MDDRNDDLLNRVRKYIETDLHVDRSRLIVVGFSGGADSVALLDLLHQLGYRCVAAHCNFQLRGDESQRDSLFARAMAESMRIPFYDVRFDTTLYASEKHLSIEMACRELRYEWFEKLRKQLDAGYIAVAHHGDDSVETFFLNLLRGTGIAGLIGIRPVNGAIIRPLICTNRQEIIAYLNARSLSYVTDSTNLEEIYLRNKIRLGILPQLKSLRPSVTESVLRTIGNLEETEKVYHWAIQDWLRRNVRVDGDFRYLNVESLLNAPSPISFLYEWLRSSGFTSPICREIMRSIRSGRSGGSGKYFLTSRYRLIRDRDDLILAPIVHSDLRSETLFYIEYGDEAPILPISLSVRYVMNRSSFEIPKQADVACFDIDKLSFPLILRKWFPGDRFRPFGMKGYQKLSDYFSDHKYSLLQKEEAWILCSGKEIVWIVGRRSSDVAKVSETTRKILMLQCK